MTRHEVTFEVDSKSDLYAVQRLLEQVHDTIREESRSVREGAESGEELSRELRRLRDAAEHRNRGRLSITYEFYDDELDG